MCVAAAFQRPHFWLTAVTHAVAASTRGAFVNIALQEPFGLVLIEAAAHGLPTVATRYGGPVELHATLKNGLLVEPTDSGAVGDALVTLLTDRHLWCACLRAAVCLHLHSHSLNSRARREACRKSGLDHIHEFSWESHCSRYFAVLDETMHNVPDNAGAPVELVEAPPVPHAQRMLVVTMCSRDAPLAAKLLQRALAAIASRALHLDMVAIVVASVLSAKVCTVAHRALHVGSDAVCLAGHAEHP